MDVRSRSPKSSRSENRRQVELCRRREAARHLVEAIVVSEAQGVLAEDDTQKSSPALPEIEFRSKPPKTMSSPSPPEIDIDAADAARVMSSPVPPSSVSSPRPPITVSLPPSPGRMSSPSVPFTVSLLSVAMQTHCPRMAPLGNSSV